MRKNKWLRRMGAHTGITARGEDGREGNLPAVKELSCRDGEFILVDILDQVKFKYLLLSGSLMYSSTIAVP